ncbi:hypothetical protein [Noviherbaspirillum suwonense]|uniref:hypothetical protein n=1 Tax=Noviherbaspirillum suwonense TaxID=1224511 RepID=UPI0024B7E5AF|nr:hypothetical protein [Noviherbaspirillum suwonense]
MIAIAISMSFAAYGDIPAFFNRFTQRRAFFGRNINSRNDWSLAACLNYPQMESRNPLFERLPNLGSSLKNALKPASPEAAYARIGADTGNPKNRAGSLSPEQRNDLYVCARPFRRDQHRGAA